MSQRPVSLDPAVAARRILRWLLAAGLLLAFIIVPFILFGDRLESWSIGILQSCSAGMVTALLGILLLIGDVVLPIPSSFVLAALGAALGWLGGTLVGALGMTLGCILAYSLGSMLGLRRVERLLLRQEQEQPAKLLDRHGMLALAALRTVPVLAEASIIAAGALHLPAARVLPIAAAANLGVSGCYALLGTMVTDGTAFAAAFVASIALPAFAMAAAGMLRRGPDRKSMKRRGIAAVGQGGSDGS